MEVNMNQEAPTMSPFCEAIMSATENVNTLKSSRDCALILCSDGDTLACRMKGHPFQIRSVLLKKMLVDDRFAKVVADAVSSYVFHMSEYTNLLANKDHETDIELKEIPSDDEQK